jgi:hypothetical protein
LDSGEDGPGPPGGLTPGPVPEGAVAPGPVRCAEAGATIASVATIATPLNKYFMTLILRCSSGLAEVIELIGDLASIMAHLPDEPLLWVVHPE